MNARVLKGTRRLQLQVGLLMQLIDRPTAAGSQPGFDHLDNHRQLIINRTRVRHLTYNAFFEKQFRRLGVRFGAW